MSDGLTELTAQAANACFEHLIDLVEHGVSLASSGVSCTADSLDSAATGLASSMSDLLFGGDMPDAPVIQSAPVEPMDTEISFQADMSELGAMRAPAFAAAMPQESVGFAMGA